MKNKTGWGKVAQWYDSHLGEADTYHNKVVLPNLDRLIDLKDGQTLLELGCGQGYFLEHFYSKSKNLTGVDIGEQLIKIAKKNNPSIDYVVASADDQSILVGKQFDYITIVLALQNMKDLNGVMQNVSRLLKKDGRVYIVLNHPAFRIPQNSDWYYDEMKDVQGRKIEKYLSQTEISIDMNPGQKGKKEVTKTFHRSLQDYSKAFNKNRLVINKIEEWISHKKSEKGPRAKAEDAARKEFPMFMCLELRKI